MPMLSIGIDVSKGKSTVCGMKPGGEIVYTPFEVQHTREGMSELVSLLRSSGEEVRAVLASTGSYHCPVVAALLENGIFVSVVNSLRMKRFCSQSIRKVKTDRIDATPEDWHWPTECLLRRRKCGRGRGRRHCLSLWRGLCNCGTYRHQRGGRDLRDCVRRSKGLLCRQDLRCGGRRYHGL